MYNEIGNKQRKHDLSILDSSRTLKKVSWKQNKQGLSFSSFYFLYVKKTREEDGGTDGVNFFVSVVSI